MRHYENSRWAVSQSTITIIHFYNFASNPTLCLLLKHLNAIIILTIIIQIPYPLQEPTHSKITSQTKFLFLFCGMLYVLHYMCIYTIVDTQRM